MNKQEIIDYINQLQNEVENGTDSIEVCFWTGTNTIKCCKEGVIKNETKHNQQIHICLYID